MQIPVDVKAVIDAATDIDTARKTPISVSIYMDETAPGDIQGCVRKAFATSAEHVRVSINYYPSATAVPDPTADLAVIVAGLGEQTGSLAADMRRAGVPCLVVTSLPEIVSELAQRNGNPIATEDLVSPDITADATALAENVDLNKEPYPLTIERNASVLLRMGEWVVATFGEKKLAFALAFPFVRKPLSLESVSLTAIQNAGVGLVVFIPGADMPVMTLNQAKMLLQIAAAYGQPLGVERVKELAAVVGGAFACRSVARQLVAVVPGLGWAVKAAIGYTGTLAMGRAAIEYFEGGGNMGAFAETLGKARDKAVMAASAASHQSTPAAAAAAAAKSVVGPHPASSVNEAVKKSASTVKNVFENAAETTGTSVSSLGKSAMKSVGSVVGSRFKKGN